MGLDIRISLHYSRKEFYLEESNYKVDSLPDMAKYQNYIINSALLYIKKRCIRYIQTSARKAAKQRFMLFRRARFVVSIQFAEFKRYGKGLQLLLSLDSIPHAASTKALGPL
jgi:hypothetical protein